MVDFSGPTLGDVTVEVRAKLDKLLNDFARARGETKNFERDMGGVTKATKDAFDETNKLEAEYRALAKAYDPVRAAATKYGDALVRIQRLQGAGFLSPAMARQWAGAARAEFDRTAMSVRNLHTRFEGIEGVIGSVRGLMAALGVTMAVELVQRLAEFAEQTIKSTAEIGEFAKQVGFTAQEVQAYRAIAADLGVTQTDVDGAFKEFNQTVRQAAAGLERPAKLFDLLNIKLNDASGQLRPMNDLFLETVEKLGQVGNKAEQAAGQAVAFGETFGPKMSQAVGMGSEKIQELVQAINDTGVVLSTEEIQKADETAKKLEQLNNQLKAKVAKTVLENADSLVTFTNSMNGLAEAALNVPGALAGVAGSIPPIAIEALKAIPVIGQMVALLQLLGQVSGNVRGFGVAGRSVTVGLGKAVPLQDRIKAAFANADRAEGKPRGDLSLAGLLAPKGRKGGGRKGGGGRTPENQFDREELRAREENLRLLRDQTSDLQLQNDIDKELIDIRVGQRAEQLDQMVARKALTAKEAEKLKAEDAANAVIEKELADRKMHSQMIEQSARYAEEMLGLEQDGLEMELRMARTDEERRRIELLILSSKQQQVRNEIEKQIALAQEAKDTERVAELVAERKKIIENQNAEIAAFDVEHLTGFAKFRNDLPKTVDEINEQIERIRFDRFRDKLQQAADFIDDIGGAFGRLADPQELFKNPLKAFKNFIFDLTRIFNENFIQKPVEEWAKKAIGGPLAKQAFGKDLMKDGGLNTEQMNVALGLASNNLRILQVAAQQAAFALQQTAGAAGAAGAGAAGADGGGFAGSLFGTSGDMVDQPMQVDLGAGLGVTGTIDFEDGLQSTTEALDPLASTAGQLTQAMSQQIPVLGQFGSGLMQVLSSLASGGGGGGSGFLGSLLNIGMAAVGGLGGLGGSLGNSVPAAPGWLGSFDTMPVSLGSGLGVTGTVGFDDGGYTGRGPRDAVRGLVHANEYVMDSDTVDRLGIPILKGLQDGSLKMDDLCNCGGGKKKKGGGLLGKLGGFLGGGLLGMIGGGGLSGIFGGGGLATGGLGLLGNLFGFQSGGFTGAGFDHDVKGLVHANEWVFDAPTTRANRPLFEAISAGRLPSWQSPRDSDNPGAGGSGGRPIMTGPINLYGVRDDRSARRSARQFRAQLQRELAHINRTGLNR